MPTVSQAASALQESLLAIPDARELLVRLAELQPEQWEELGKKGLEKLRDRMRSQLEDSIENGQHREAVQLWQGFLRVLPDGKHAQRTSRPPPELHAPVLNLLQKSRSLWSQGKVEEADELLAFLEPVGVQTEAIQELRQQIAQILQLEARFQEHLSRTRLASDTTFLPEAEIVLKELERLLPARAVHLRPRFSLLHQARQAFVQENREEALLLLDRLAREGLRTGPLLQELEEQRDVVLGPISHTVVTPALPVEESPTPRTWPTREKQLPQEVPTARLPAPTRRMSPAADLAETPVTLPTQPKPTPTAKGEPTRTPRPVLPSPTAMPGPRELEQRQLLARLRQLARLEVRRYHALLAESGAPEFVPRLEVQELIPRGWGIEVQLTASSPHPDIQSLLLPQADRQFLRLLAHRVLENAPEYAEVSLALWWISDVDSPRYLGQLRIPSSTLKLTHGQTVEAFWQALDGSGLDHAWEDAPLALSQGAQP